MTAEEVAKHLGVELPEPNIDSIIKAFGGDFNKKKVKPFADLAFF